MYTSPRLCIYLYGENDYEMFAVNDQFWNGSLTQTENRLITKDLSSQRSIEYTTMTFDAHGTMCEGHEEKMAMLCS